MGIDLGGSWLRACLAGPDGRVLRRTRRPKVAWQQLDNAILVLRRRWGFGRLETLTVGAKGVWKVSERGALARRLKGLAKTVHVMSDLELAHAAAFSGGAGILVLAGTGSAAYGRDGKGRAERAGGLGTPFGGMKAHTRSGWGRRALARTRGCPEGFPPRIGSAVPGAQTPRLSVGPRALRPRSCAGRAATRRRARSSTTPRGSSPASPRSSRGRAAPLARLSSSPSRHGGLFDDMLFRRRFLAALRRRETRFRVRPPSLPPDVAAARAQR